LNYLSEYHIDLYQTLDLVSYLPYHTHLKISIKHLEAKALPDMRLQWHRQQINSSLPS
jgi:hypothetical protein